ncbi:filament-like plant protein 7 isoform X2 [Prosopis cineraria]|uniref:filament-like plant protein 7 isoform X2 n=1 Tax=Prosopis cineraria TaxID=364024 RepID=UPI00240FFB47|nr:filament-like plant protein 7 isoform X2 [Prosopis cineraria]
MALEEKIYGEDNLCSGQSYHSFKDHRSRADINAAVERSSKSLNEKLASVLLDSHDAEGFPPKHEQTSRGKIEGEDKATEVVESCEKEGDEDLIKETSTESMFGAVPDSSKEHEKIQKELEEKLQENCKRLADLTIENTSLTNALLAKDKSIGDLLNRNRQMDAEYSTLVDRLDSTVKENAFLKYEFHMLEKELEIRKEEMGYSRQYAEASHKQYQETVQKVSKLEVECQRLHLLLQKRAPQSAMVNRKNEVGIMGGDKDMRRRSNPTRDLICNKTARGNSPEVSNKSINLMIKRLQDLDEENKALKRILTKKNSELESSRNMYAQTATKLSQAEILVRKLSLDHKSMELGRFYPVSNELSVVSKFDIASDDGVSSSGSWANALISELEHLTTGEIKDQKIRKAIEVSEMSLLDDLTEMEKRAIVSVDTPKREYYSDLTSRELVLLEQEFGFSDGKQETEFRFATYENSFDWLQIVLKATLEQQRISKRSFHELFEDIRIALGCINPPTSCKSDTAQKFRNSSSFNSATEEKSNQYLSSNLRNSMSKIIKLIEDISPVSLICNNCPYDCLENQNPRIPQSPTSKEYFVHVFQWKLSDLNPLLHQLVHTCKDLLSGRADLEEFAHEVAFALDWSINNCASPTNSSVARDRIKKHFSCHDSQNGNENQIVDDKTSLSSPLVVSPDDQRAFSNMNDNQNDLLKENRKLKDELRSTESVKNNLEAKLQLVNEESQGLKKQLQEAQNTITGLQSELETQKESNEIIVDQIEKQKLINEDLDTQLAISHAKLNDIFQKLSSLEVELEDKKNSCEELEATCLELQLQIESIAKKEAPVHGGHEVEKMHQTGLEITTASSKLAECQETILNLGKQLKALASSSDSALFDSVFLKTSAMANPTHEKNLFKRSSLRSQMQAEDDTKSGILPSYQIEGNKTISGVKKPPPLQSDNSNVLQVPNTQETNLASDQNDRSNIALGALAMVPARKQGGFGLLRKLLLRRKRGRGKGTQSLGKT